MVRQISIGNESFRDIRVEQVELVDKTRMLEQLCEDSAKVLLFPRPRRFGKTVALSMIREFFSIPVPEPTGKLPEPPARELFRGLYLDSVWEKVEPHFQRYPTLNLNFKGMRFTNTEEWWRVIAQRLSYAFEGLEPLLTHLAPREQDVFQSILDRKAQRETLSDSLRLITQWLYRATGEKVLVLIDEYDAPIQDAWVRANELTDEVIARLPTETEKLEARREQRAARLLYDEVIGFFRVFLGNGLKTNDSLYKGILTGILRVAKESLFSGFNNVKICTMMEEPYSDAFGFTEEEVYALFVRQEQLGRLEEARIWYDGYRFGSHIMYNPWSITNFLEFKPQFPKPYWLNTSENALIKQLLRRATRDTAEEFERLLLGGDVRQPIRDALSLGDLARDAQGLFNLLFWSGYLRADVCGVMDSGEALYALTIPNREVRMLFQESFREPLSHSVAGSGLKVKNLTEAILTGHDKLLQVTLSHLALHLISYLDGDPNDPEAFYQGLMLGLCAWLEGSYKVRSNRETGLGRADLLILPKQPGKAGAILELKSTREGVSLQTLIRQGERQLKKRLYAAELEASGASPLHRWIIAFDGKTLKVKKLKGA
ncbi:MAG: AAA family ATPase [Myxococcota bacterium]